MYALPPMINLTIATRKENVSTFACASFLALPQYIVPHVGQIFSEFSMKVLWCLNLVETGEEMG